jgi:WD40-like Beta Propeller Repeat
MCRHHLVNRLLAAAAIVLLGATAAVATPPLPTAPILVAEIVPNGPNSELGRFLSINPDGSGRTALPISLGEWGFAQPAVSPDGTRIAYIKRVPNTEPFGDQFRRELWVVNSNGSGAARVVDADHRDVASARWSPDGGLIAFGATVWPGPEPGFTNGSGLFVVRPDGTGLRRIDNYSAGPGYAFTPAGGAILYRGVVTSASDVPLGCPVSLPLATLIQVDLVTGARATFGPCAEDRSGVDVSPDGTRIAYLTYDSYFDYNIESRIDIQRLWIAGAQGQDPRLVLETSSGPGAGRWWVASEAATPASFSPDGQWLLITRRFNFSLADLALVSVADGSSVPVPNTALPVFTGVWAPGLLPPPTPDTTPPTISITNPSSGSKFTIGSSAVASYTCLDEAGGTGLKTCTGTTPTGAAIDTATIGLKAFSVTASDVAGNTRTLSVPYRVIWPFSGFLTPVDPLPTLNEVKAGKKVLVRFSLSGNRGLAVIAAGYPRSEQIACSSTSPVDGIEETLSQGNGLSYAVNADGYEYKWDTDKLWSGTCRQFVLKLADGMTYRARFRFT